VSAPLDRVWLRATSGPISPAYRWSIDVEARRLEADGDGRVRVQVRDRRVRGASHPRGALDVDREGTVDVAALDALWAALAATGVSASLEEGDGGALDEATRRRKGGGPCVLEIAQGGTTRRREFLSRALDEEDGEAAMIAAARAIEALAASLSAGA
jgi:hypothetical protein